MNFEPLKARTRRSGAALLLCCICLTLPGCSQPGPEQRLDNYLQRLARTLELDFPEITVIATPKPPKTSELRLALASANLDALDFLSLSGCGVQITIGKRNSSLGRFASDSQRLLLELEYLQLAPECIDYMRQSGKPELAATLEAAFTLKRGQLPQLIYNATLANIEFRALWKKPPALANYPQQTSSSVLSALAAITLDARRWLAGDYRADNKGFEILLSEVAKGDGGALLLALAVQDSRLEAANQLLEDRLASRPLCSDQYRNRAADILPNVVQKYFIGEVQPWSAALGRRYHELIPPLLELEQLLNSALPKNYAIWKGQRERAFSQLISSPRQHVQLLKKILAPCR